MCLGRLGGKPRQGWIDSWDLKNIMENLTTNQPVTSDSPVACHCCQPSGRRCNNWALSSDLSYSHSAMR